MNRLTAGENPRKARTGAGAVAVALDTNVMLIDRAEALTGRVDRSLANIDESLALIDEATALFREVALPPPDFIAIVNSPISDRISNLIGQIHHGP